MVPPREPGAGNYALAGGPTEPFAGRPNQLVEAARVDGAGHVKIFFVVLMPLLVPAIAAFGIFQFLWVWNDLLVATVFAPSPNLRPITAAVAELSGTKGSQWELLSAGAFISIVVPLACA